MQMQMFKALAEGYLSSAGEFLTKTERDNLVFGSLIITYEQAIGAFDYIDGKLYWKIRAAEQCVSWGQCDSNSTANKYIKEVINETLQ